MKPILTECSRPLETSKFQRKIRGRTRWENRGSWKRNISLIGSKGGWNFLLYWEGMVNRWQAVAYQIHFLLSSWSNSASNDLVLAQPYFFLHAKISRSKLKCLFHNYWDGSLICYNSHLNPSTNWTPPIFIIWLLYHKDQWTTKMTWRASSSRGRFFSGLFGLGNFNKNQPPVNNLYQEQTNEENSYN